MTTHIFALLTTQGTAVPASALCETHVEDSVTQDQARVLGIADDVTDYTFHDCTGNDELQCIACPENWDVHGRRRGGAEVTDTDIRAHLESPHGLLNPGETAEELGWASFESMHDYDHEHNRADNLVEFNGHTHEGVKPVDDPS